MKDNNEDQHMLLGRLSPQERKQLELCGITKDSQLSKVTAEKLIQELAIARTLFPDAAITLTERQISSLCEQAQALYGEQSDQAPPLPPELDLSQLKLLPAHYSGHKEFSPRESAPARHSPPRGKSKPKGLDCHIATHPVALRLSAVLVLLLLLGTAFMAYLGACAIIGLELPFPVYLIGIGSYLLLWVLYLVTLSQARCIICRGIMCSFFTSKRSVHAHHVPYLGHTIPAACSILFLSDTICPHCGTRQILRGERPSHRSH